MAEFTDMAVALVNRTFTLFTGTGFSKYLTNGEAPSWPELLVDCTKVIDKGNKLFRQLFNTDVDGNPLGSKFDLSICAQILEQEYIKERLDLKQTVCDIIRKRINPSTVDSIKVNTVKNFLLSHPYVSIVTTNYDTLISEYVLPDSSHVFIENSTLPRINTGTSVYHIHGCITKPSSIILTLNDYYKFQNSRNYFSRKFFTLLQENTVAVIGYSLGDFNLNSILNEVRSSRKESFVKSDIFYVTRNKIEDIYRKFYSYTYGIQAIEQCEIDLFFSSITASYSEAKKIVDSIANLKKVLYENYKYKDEFLRLSIALDQILIQASSLGIEHSDEQFLKLLIKVLEKKKEFSRENSAWNQYVHLADWLTTIATLITIKGSQIEDKYCEFANYSFSYCSKKLFVGYSWDAYNIWKKRWGELRIENQLLLKDLIDEKYPCGDYREIKSIYEAD